VSEPPVQEPRTEGKASWRERLDPDVLDPAPRHYYPVLRLLSSTFASTLLGVLGVVDVLPGWIKPFVLLAGIAGAIAAVTWTLAGFAQAARPRELSPLAQGGYVLATVVALVVWIPFVVIGVLVVALMIDPSALR
jgi:hypothetical protein